MSTPRFSIVIPTRERADTLPFALRTCLDQTFDDYEVVVSDNCSTPATRAVVDAIASPKVRYVRTAEPVAMSNNWEFGVAQARGEYVLVIGDDDGLLPHALHELDGLVQARAPKAIRWALALYTWPTLTVAGQANYLRVSLGRSLVERDGAEAIREVVGFRAHYADLPMMYNTAVRRDVLDRLRRETGGVFLHSNPDVYSGFAIAHAAGRYLSTSVPMTVCGLSRASNGAACLCHRGRTPIAREYHALNAKAGLLADPAVPDLPIYPDVPVADAFAVAKRGLFPERDVKVDRRELARACLNKVEAAEEEWPAVLEAIRRSFDDAPDLRRWFDAELASTPYRANPPLQLRASRLGLYDAQLHLDAAAFGVRDIAAAARLCGRVLNSGCPIQYTTDDQGDHAAAVVAAATGWDDHDRAVLALHLSASEAYALREAGEREAGERARAAAQAAERERAALIDSGRILQGVANEREAIIGRLEGHVRGLTDRLKAERRWSLKRPVRVVKRLLTALARTTPSH